MRRRASFEWETRSDGGPFKSRYKYEIIIRDSDGDSMGQRERRHPARGVVPSNVETPEGRVTIRLSPPRVGDP